MDSDDALNLIEPNSVQTIYIDPPYNTQSKSFEYFDTHKNWESFILSKIRKSYDILLDTGFVFISIDDNKLIELRYICDQVFSRENFLGMFITRQATRSNAKHLNTIHEYIVVYAKNKKKAPKFEIKRLDIPYYSERLNPIIADIKKTYNKSGKEIAEKKLKAYIKNLEKNELFSWLKNYSLVDENGEICFATDLSTPGEPNELKIDEIGLYLPPLKSRSWSSKEKFIRLYNENKLIYKQGRPYEKHLLTESTDSAMSILNFYSRQGKHDLEKLGMGELFSTAKPVEMIKYFIKISQLKEDDVILDFFAGSGTTAQAVIECNYEDGKKRNFILCQISEEIKGNKKAIQFFNQLNRPSDIAEITKLRLEKLQQKYNFRYEIQ